MNRAGNALWPRPPPARGRPADRAAATVIYAVTLLQPQQRTYQSNRQPLGCCLVGKRLPAADRFDKGGKLSLVLLLQSAGIEHAHDASPPLVEMISTSAPV